MPTSSFAGSSQPLRLLIGDLLVTEYSLVLLCSHLCILFGAIRGSINVGGDLLDITLESLVFDADLSGLTLVQQAARDQRGRQALRTQAKYKGSTGTVASPKSGEFGVIGEGVRWFSRQPTSSK